MTKITTQHEDKRGTITNSESRIVGKITFVDVDVFGFRAASSERINVFDRSEWDFEPERVKLPTAPGTVIKVKDALYFRVTNSHIGVGMNAGWVSATHASGLVSDDTMREYVEQSDSFTVVFDPTEEA